MDRWGSAPAAGAFQSGLLVAVAPPLYPGTTPPTKSRNSPATDAAAQRHRSLEHDVQNRLAMLSAAHTLMNLSDDCWTPAPSFAKVIEVAINR